MKKTTESIRRIEEINKALQQLQYLQKIYRSDELHYINKSILPLEQLLQEELLFAYKARLITFEGDD